MEVKPFTQLSLKAFLQVAKQYWSHVVLIVAGTILFSYAVVWFTPKKYQAVATIMSLSDGNASAMGGNALLQVMGLTKSMQEGFGRFMAIVKSRSFQEQLFESLGPDFFRPKKDWQGSEEALRNHGMGVLAKGIDLKMEPDQPSVLSIIVKAEDPEMPVVIANQILIDLQKYISQNSLTGAKRLRNYIEDNILETKAAIFETAKAIADFYQRYAVNPQKAKVEYPLRKEILDLSAKSFDEISTDPLLKENFGLLEEKKQKLVERLQAIKEIPEQSYFDYLQEEYQILKEINLTLRQQHELAKLEAVKQEPAFQILDKAVGASYAGLNRRRTFFTSIVIAILLASVYLLARGFYLPPPPKATLGWKPKLDLTS